MTRKSSQSRPRLRPRSTKPHFLFHFPVGNTYTDFPEKDISEDLKKVKEGQSGKMWWGKQGLWDVYCLKRGSQQEVKRLAYEIDLGIRRVEDILLAHGIHYTPPVRQPPIRSSPIKKIAPSPIHKATPPAAQRGRPKGRKGRSSSTQSAVPAKKTTPKPAKKTATPPLALIAAASPTRGRPEKKTRTSRIALNETSGSPTPTRGPPAKKETRRSSSGTSSPRKLRSNSSASETPLAQPNCAIAAVQKAAIIQLKQEQVEDSDDVMMNGGEEPALQTDSTKEKTPTRSSPRISSRKAPALRSKTTTTAATDKTPPANRGKGRPPKKMNGTSTKSTPPLPVKRTRTSAEATAASPDVKPSVTCGKGRLRKNMNDTSAKSPPPLPVKRTRTSSEVTTPDVKPPVKCIKGRPRKNMNGTSAKSPPPLPVKRTRTSAEDATTSTTPAKKGKAQKAKTSSTRASLRSPLPPRSQSATPVQNLKRDTRLRSSSCARDPMPVEGEPLAGRTRQKSLPPPSKRVTFSVDSSPEVVIAKREVMVAPIKRSGGFYPPPVNRCISMYPSIDPFITPDGTPSSSADEYSDGDEEEQPCSSAQMTRRDTARRARQVASPTLKREAAFENTSAKAMEDVSRMILEAQQLRKALEEHKSKDSVEEQLMELKEAREKMEEERREREKEEKKKEKEIERQKKLLEEEKAKLAKERKIVEEWKRAKAEEKKAERRAKIEEEKREERIRKKKEEEELFLKKRMQRRQMQDDALRKEEEKKQKADEKSRMKAESMRKQEKEKEERMKKREEVKRKQEEKQLATHEKEKNQGKKKAVDEVQGSGKTPIVPPGDNGAAQPLSLELSSSTSGSTVTTPVSPNAPPVTASVSTIADSATSGATKEGADRLSPVLADPECSKRKKAAIEEEQDGNKKNNNKGGKKVEARKRKESQERVVNKRKSPNNGPVISEDDDVITLSDDEEPMEKKRAREGKQVDSADIASTSSSVIKDTKEPVELIEMDAAEASTTADFDELLEPCAVENGAPHASPAALDGQEPSENDAVSAADDAEAEEQPEDANMDAPEASTSAHLHDELLEPNEAENDAPHASPAALDGQEPSEMDASEATTVDLDELLEPDAVANGAPHASPAAVDVQEPSENDAASTADEPYSQEQSDAADITADLDELTEPDAAAMDASEASTSAHLEEPMELDAAEAVGPSAPAIPEVLDIQESGENDMAIADADAADNQEDIELQDGNLEAPEDPKEPEDPVPTTSLAADPAATEEHEENEGGAPAESAAVEQLLIDEEVEPAVDEIEALASSRSSSSSSSGVTETIESFNASMPVVPTEESSPNESTAGPIDAAEDAHAMIQTAVDDVDDAGSEEEAAEPVDTQDDNDEVEDSDPVEDPSNGGLPDVSLE